MTGEDDRVHCPWCGAEARNAWQGSCYKDRYDTLEEDATYICDECGKEYSAHFVFKFMSVDIRKEE